MRDGYEIGGLILFGFIIGFFVWLLLLGSLANMANINHEDGYESIEVIQITKYSDGMQVIATTGYTELFGMRLSNNYTYSDPHQLISSLGIHKVKRADSIVRSIDDVISIVEIVSQEDNKYD